MEVELSIERLEEFRQSTVGSPTIQSASPFGPRHTRPGSLLLHIEHVVCLPHWESAQRVTSPGRAHSADGFIQNLLARLPCMCLFGVN